jgi:hypothetical protein
MRNVKCGTSAKGVGAQGKLELGVPQDRDGRFQLSCVAGAFAINPARP